MVFKRKPTSTRSSSSSSKLEKGKKAVTSSQIRKNDDAQGDGRKNRERNQFVMPNEK